MDFKDACEMCGLSLDDFPGQSKNDWKSLGRRFLEIQMEADRVSQSKNFDPYLPGDYDTKQLERRFPKSSVQIIIAMATLLALSLNDDADIDDDDELMQNSQR